MANEALFSSGIMPDRKASSLTEQECDVLVNAIKTVLTRSIEQGGTTLKDFLQSMVNQVILPKSYLSTGAKIKRA